MVSELVSYYFTKIARQCADAIFFCYNDSIILQGDAMNKTYKAKIAVQLYSVHQYTKAVGLKKTIEDVAGIGNSR